MKHKKSVRLLVMVIVGLSLFATLTGLMKGGGPGEFSFTSIQGETVQIYGEGLYRYDSVSAAAQVKAQDIVTLALGIPLLLVSLLWAGKGSLKGRLLLSGTLAFFLYTYASMSFLAMFNSIFLIYVLLMSASFFAFTLTMTSFDQDELRSAFKETMPVKWLGGFLCFVGVMIALMWLGRLIDPLLHGSVPIGLEHYATLVIQALDLGFIVPISILAGILVIRKVTFGYLLSSVVILKGFTLSVSVLAMIVGMLAAGEEVAIGEVIPFTFITIIAGFFMFLLFRNVREPVHSRYR